MVRCKIIKQSFREGGFDSFVLSRDCWPELMSEIVRIGAGATYPLPRPIAGMGAEPFFVRRHPIARPLLLSVVLLAALPSAPALAFDGPSLEARGSMGVGSMLSQAQRDQGYHSGFVPDLHPGLRVSEVFVAELALASWFFPREGALGTGRATSASRRSSSLSSRISSPGNW